MEIYEDGIEIGTLKIEEQGLYTQFTCDITPSQRIKRVYLAYPYTVKYLGLPDRNGHFRTRIAKKLLPKSYCATASEENGHWMPWRGQIEGVWIESAWVSDHCIALPLADAMKFPAWDLEVKEIHEIKMALLPLSEDGVPLPREREAVTNETFDIDDFVPGDFTYLPSDDSNSSQGWQADCTDL